jgi:hypothetical protein
VKQFLFFRGPPPPPCSTVTATTTTNATTTALALTNATTTLTANANATNSQSPHHCPCHHHYLKSHGGHLADWSAAGSGRGGQLVVVNL